MRRPGFFTALIAAILAVGAIGTSFASTASPSAPPAAQLLTTDQQLFAAEFTGRTGMNEQVIEAWLLAEESGSAADGRQANDNNDWLNIGYTDSSTYGAADSIWADPVTAADASAGWMQGHNSIPQYGVASAGVQAILSTAGQPPSVQIAALQNSGWASSAYPDLPSLYSEISGSPLLATGGGALAPLGVDVPAAQVAALPSFTALTAPNQPGKYLTFNSGLKDVVPCANAQVTLQPIWAEAAQAYRLDWTVLAAITKVETDFGCDLATSSAGAIGWTQFEPATWTEWGVNADDGATADPGDAVDAIFATARYLRASGAPGNYNAAIFAYNHSAAYVSQVLGDAAQFRSLGTEQFAQAAALTDHADALRARVVSLQQQIVGDDRQRLADATAWQQAQRTLAGSQQRLAVSTAASRKSHALLNEQTLQYTQVVQGLQVGQPGESQTSALLRYITGASAQNADTVYQSASDLLALQNTLLRNLTLAEEAAQVAQTQVAVENADDKAAAVQRAEAALSSAQTSRDAATSLSTARRALVQYQGDIAQYAANGPGGNLDASPLEADRTNAATPGRLRWPASGTIAGQFGQATLSGPLDGVQISTPDGANVIAAATGVVQSVRSPDAATVTAGDICISVSAKIVVCTDGISPNPRLVAGAKVVQGHKIGKSACVGACVAVYVTVTVKADGVAVDPIASMPALR